MALSPLPIEPPALPAAPAARPPAAGVRPSAPGIVHILSVDVEDYFQVEAFADVVPRDDWDRYPTRVDPNTRRLLDLFDRNGARGTFFFLGWVAERFPRLVREVLARGHELACHSYWHRRIYRLTPAEFREDTRRAKAAIEQAAGTVITGYRAPTWSITRQSLWALDVLAEEGFLYDSSIFPIRHDLYGVPGGRRFAHLLPCGHGRSLQEYPPATIRLAGVNLPAAGGGYLRLFPSLYTRWAFRQISRQGQPVVVYFHPWEIDPHQPRLPGRLRSRFRHYFNLHRMEQRVEVMLRRYRFQPFRECAFPAEAP
jgi:polysaccharide deacetylase family protein (PEP-CTERM system associated)